MKKTKTNQNPTTTTLADLKKFISEDQDLAVLTTAAKMHPNFIASHFEDFERYPQQTIFKMLDYHEGHSATPDCPDYDPKYPVHCKYLDMELRFFEYEQLKTIVNYIFSLYEKEITAKKKYDIPFEMTLISTDETDCTYLKKVWDYVSDDDLCLIDQYDLDDLDERFIVNMLNKIIKGMPKSLEKAINDASYSSLYCFAMLFYQYRYEA